MEPHSLLQYCTLPCRTSSSNMPTVQYSTVRYLYSMCSDGGSTGGCPPWLNENIGGSKGGFPPWLNENMGGPQGGFPPGLIAAQPATVLYSTVQYCLPSAGGPSDRIFSSRVLEKFRTVPFQKESSKSAANHFLWKGIWRETCMQRMWNVIGTMSTILPPPLMPV